MPNPRPRTGKKITSAAGATLSMHPILKKLSGGDRRSIGRSNEVVAEVLANPARAGQLVRVLVNALTGTDQVLRMRASDAIEKIAAQRPQLLRPFKRNLLALAGSSSQQEVRWHLAQFVPRLKLRSNEAAAFVEILVDYLRDKSSIVKTFAMEGLADLASNDQKLKSQIRPLLKELTQIGTPAMRARGRKLLREL
jgi:hypothetical protein